MGIKQSKFQRLKRNQTISLFFFIFFFQAHVCLKGVLHGVFAKAEITLREKLPEEVGPVETKRLSRLGLGRKDEEPDLAV